MQNLKEPVNITPSLSKQTKYTAKKYLTILQKKSKYKKKLKCMLHN